MKVQAQSHFAKKVELDGYRFDSQKEATFYQRYVKPSLNSICLLACMACPLRWLSSERMTSKPQSREQLRNWNPSSKLT